VRGFCSEQPISSPVLYINHPVMPHSPLRLRRIYTNNVAPTTIRVYVEYSLGISMQASWRLL